MIRALLRREPRGNFDDLSTEEHLETLLLRSRKEPVIIYKHSNICGLSNIAEREIRALVENHAAAVYKLVVQRARHISDRIEEMFGIRHESPQAILVHNGRAVYNASHRRIRSNDLESALRESARSDE